MKAILVGALAVALLGSSISCIDGANRRDDAASAGGAGGTGGAVGASTFPISRFNPATSGAFLAYWQGQLQISMQESWASAGHDHPARSVSIVAGLGKGVAPRYVLEDVPAGAIRSSTPTRATARVVEAGPLPKLYASQEGSVTVEALPSTGHDFGRYRVHVDMIVAEVTEASTMLHLVGDADVPVLRGAVTAT